MEVTSPNNNTKEKFNIKVIFDENARSLQEVVEEAFAVYIKTINS